MGVQLWEGSDIASTSLCSHGDGVYLSLVINHNSTNPFRSCSRVMVSILDDAQRSCLTYCGSPDTNAHVIQCLGSGSPTNQVRQCKSAKNSSIFLFSQSCRTVNLSNALKVSIAYAVIRALFISSGSILCSWLSCQYMVRTPPHSCNSSTCSTLSIAHSSQTISTCSSHSTIGISVTVPLNSGINRISNALPIMVDEW